MKNKSYQKIFIYILFFFLTSFVYSQSVFSAVNTDTLEGYWKFNETSQGSVASDASGDSHTATPFGTGGGAVPSTDIPTVSFPDTRSIDFNGTDQYYEVTNDATFNGSTFSIAFWAKFENINSTHQTLIGKWQVGVKQQYVVQLTSGNKIGFWTGDGGTGTSGALTSTLTPNQDEWYHITIVADGSNKRLYINGTQNKYIGTGTSPGSSNIELSIGSKKDGSGSYFEFLNGKIDDLRYYSRALSDEEVDDLVAGNHLTATWDGSTSQEYEQAANWDINAIPDPYTHVIIANAGNQPVTLSENISVSNLSINSSASLDLSGYSVTYTDNGGLINNGTLYSNGIPTHSPSTISSSNSGYSCSYSPPGYSPDLFQVDAHSTKATLYFTPVIDNADRYFIAFGYKSGDMRFGGELLRNSTGVLAFTINNLSPKTTYFIRVRAGNSCAPGGWSNEMKITTVGNNVFFGNRFYKSYNLNFFKM